MYPCKLANTDLIWLYSSSINEPMYIESVPNRNSPPAILLRESWREDGKVRKRTLANLSCLSTEVIEGSSCCFVGAWPYPAPKRSSPLSAPCRMATSRPSWAVRAVAAR